MLVATTPVDGMPSPERCATPAGRSAVNEPDGVECQSPCARTRPARGRVPVPLPGAWSEAQGFFKFAVAVLSVHSQEAPEIRVPAGNPFPCGDRLFCRSGKVLSR